MNIAEKKGSLTIKEADKIFGEKNWVPIWCNMFQMPNPAAGLPDNYRDFAGYYGVSEVTEGGLVLLNVDHEEVFAGAFGDAQMELLSGCKTAMEARVLLRQFANIEHA